MLCRVLSWQALLARSDATKDVDILVCVTRSLCYANHSINTRQLAALPRPPGDRPSAAKGVASAASYTNMCWSQT